MHVPWATMNGGGLGVLPFIVDREIELRDMPEERQVGGPSRPHISAVPQAIPVLRATNEKPDNRIGGARGVARGGARGVARGGVRGVARGGVRGGARGGVRGVARGGARGGVRGG